MIDLSAMDRDLLGFLCSCAEKRIQITKINESRLGSLARLREAQEIMADSFEPFPWALEAWRNREDQKTAAPKHSGPEEPVPPAPVGREGAALCSDAAAQAAGAEAAPSCEIAKPAPEEDPTSAPAPISGADLADLIESFCRDRGIAPSRFGKICCSGRGGIVRMLRRKKPTPFLIDQIRAGLADPPEELFEARKPRCRRILSDAEQADRIRRANARRADKVRKGAVAKAMERIEKGLGPADVNRGGAGVHVRMAQIAIEERMREEARRLDPIERAKSLLRRRYAPVVSAEVCNGPAGMFIVGRKTVSKDQLLEMAGMAA